MKVNVLCLYYDIMNLYGDTGNVKVLEYHLKEQGIDYNIDYKSIDDKIVFSDYNIVFIGASNEENRFICLDHLIKYKKDIKKYVEDGGYFLATGNSVSMFGKSLYERDAVGLFSYDVCESKERISKEVILENNICSSIYGFVNHQDIVNNLDSDMYLFDGEGIHYKNFFGTFVLGPILSRNPEFLEYFFKGFVSSIDDKFKFKDMNVALNKKAYDGFIEFKKTKVFNSHNA